MEMFRVCACVCVHVKKLSVKQFLGSALPAEGFWTARKLGQQGSASDQHGGTENTSIPPAGLQSSLSRGTPRIQLTDEGSLLLLASGLQSNIWGHIG